MANETHIDVNYEEPQPESPRGADDQNTVSFYFWEHCGLIQEGVGKGKLGDISVMATPMRDV